MRVATTAELKPAGFDKANDELIPEGRIFSRRQRRVVDESKLEAVFSELTEVLLLA